VTFLHRLLATAAGTGVVSLIVAFALRHTKHGLGLAMGNVAWFSLTAATLAVLVLGAAALAAAVRGRRRRGPVIR
jgi:hypothetical protein